MGDWNVARYKQRLRAFNVERETAKAVRRESFWIVEMNKQNLDKGLNSLDKLVGVYSPFTAAWAKKDPIPNMNKSVGSPYNFNWTGKFINGLFIKYENDVITFSSKGLGLTSKSRFIKTNQLMGLSKKRGREMNYKILAPALRESFVKHLNK